MELVGWDGGMVGWWLEWDGREQKVGFAEKKLRLTQKKWRIVCIKGGM